MTVIQSNDLYIPASVYRRLFALVYDTFVVFSFCILATTLALIVNKGQSFLEVRTLFLTYMVICIGLFLSWFWTHGGQTLGMLAWKIKLVDEHHRPVSFKRAFVRYLLAFGFSVISILWCLFDKDQQALHDRLAGTRVIRIFPKKALNDP